MRRHTKIVQISGFKGVLIVLFVASCLAAGFIVFPAILSMNLWNFISEKTYVIPQINFIQGLLLWAIIAITIYILNERNKYFFSITTKKQLTEQEVRKLINRIRMQHTQIFNPMAIKGNSNKELTSTKEDKKENV
ncbi:hypothetical protein II810_03365 [bacterium]|nr:hypothetical protein [bacterium]